MRYSARCRNDFEKWFKNKIDGCKFYEGMGNAYWPNKLLGAGCAAWVVRSVLALSDEFHVRLGIPAPYEGIRETLLSLPA